MLLRLCLCLFLAAILAGCGKSVKSQVQTSHRLGGGVGNGKTVAIQAGDEKKAGTLEYQAFAEKLAAKFTQIGLRVTEIEKGPDYVALLNYGIDDGQPVTETHSIPRWGQTGVSSSYTTGTITSHGRTGSFIGTTTYTPTYGVTGYSTATTTSMVYSRAVIISLRRYRGAVGGDFPVVMEMTITSSGPCGSLASVMDEMLTAAFDDFPGENGSSRTVSVPLDGRC